MGLNQNRALLRRHVFLTASQTHARHVPKEKANDTNLGPANATRNKEPNLFPTSKIKLHADKVTHERAGVTMLGQSAIGDRVAVTKC